MVVSPLNDCDTRDFCESCSTSDRTYVPNARLCAPYGGNCIIPIHAAADAAAAAVKVDSLIIKMQKPHTVRHIRLYDRYTENTEQIDQLLARQLALLTSYRQVLRICTLRRNLPICETCL